MLLFFAFRLLRSFALFQFAWQATWNRYVPCSQTASTQSTVYGACVFVSAFFSALVIRENNNNTYQLEVRYVHIILWMRSTLLHFLLNFFSSFHAVLERCCCCCRLVSSAHMLSYWVHYCTLYHSLFRFAIFAQCIFLFSLLEFSFEIAMILMCFIVVV